MKKDRKLLMAHVIPTSTKQHNWDLYFLRLAREVSKNSKCLSRKIGAVLVKEKSIISTGYNGPARGVKHCNERTSNFLLVLDNKIPHKLDKDFYFPNCPRKALGYKSGEGLHLCQAGHAERNALIQAARNGISTLDTSLYCWCPQVCKDCAIEIVNAGVKELIFLEGSEYDGYSNTILKESGIIIRKVKEEEL